MKVLPAWEALDSKPWYPRLSLWPLILPRASPEPRRVLTMASPCRREGAGRGRASSLDRGLLAFSAKGQRATLWGSKSSVASTEFHYAREQAAAENS